MIEENKEELHVCVYCGQPAYFQFKNGKWCCSQFMTQCPKNRERNSENIKRPINAKKN